MANEDTGSRTNGTDHDFLAAFLGGEIQRKHWNEVEAAGLGFPGIEDEDAPYLGNGIEGEVSEVSDARPVCSSCCPLDSRLEPCITDPPQCKTVEDCHTHARHCKTHEEHCHPKKAYEAQKHGSWFDKR